jgi:hypothetical protein
VAHQERELLERVEELLLDVHALLSEVRRQLGEHGALPDRDLPVTTEEKITIVRATIDAAVRRSKCPE